MRLLTMYLKLVVLIAVLTSSTLADVRNFEREQEALVNAVKQEELAYANAVKRERAVRVRLRKNTVATETQRLREELDEERHVIVTLAARKRELQARLTELTSSPSFVAYNEINADRRRPQRDDISGVWVVTMALGYVVQLEQRGHRVHGRGYHGGCLGVYDFFAVTGDYQGNALSLTFPARTGRMEKRVFRPVPNAGLMFEAGTERGVERIRPLRR